MPRRRRGPGYYLRRLSWLSRLHPELYSLVIDGFAHVAEHTDYLSELQDSLERRGNSIEEREIGIEEREISIEEREISIEEREISVGEWVLEVNRRQRDATQREEENRRRAEILDAREKALSEKQRHVDMMFQMQEVLEEALLQWLEHEMLTWEKAITKQKEAIEAQEEAGPCREACLKHMDHVKHAAHSLYADERQFEQNMRARVRQLHSTFNKDAIDGQTEVPPLPMDQPTQMTSQGLDSVNANPQNTSGSSGMQSDADVARSTQASCRDDATRSPGSNS